jgi:diaminohydroxyphosphoribosylaminopyrimidine deaminase/5-amino-6-(5-phosphoribosylamino)uracil reductase
MAVLYPEVCLRGFFVLGAILSNEYAFQTLPIESIMSVLSLNTHRKYMRMALSLASKGKGKVSPNPLVGCVIVRDGAIVGKGYHEYFGGPHAEINALAQAGTKARGSTMYVTLEPCNHTGKTPPCTDAIIRAGINQVIVATPDPDGKVRGSGLRRLRMNSIDVSSGLMKREATRLNSSYLVSRKDASAKVIVKAAMSADGKIATRTGDSKWISSKQSRSAVHKLRNSVDAVVVGSNTVLRDNPHLTSHGVGRNPVRVILDSGLRTPLGSNVFDGKAPTIVFYVDSRQQKKLVVLRKRNVITVWMPRRRGRPQFSDVIAKLRQFSLSRVLVEGGGETIASAIESGVATDLVLFIAAKIVGGRSAKTPVEGLGIANIRDAVKLQNPRIIRVGADWMLTAKLRNKRSKRRSN